jgi:threonine/homoserine/homoserine lactone efflux protein
MGVLVSAPVGPVNILCIQRTIERGSVAGIMSGLGAVLGDTLIALMAALGIGQITDVIATHRTPIQLVGGILLIGYAIKVTRTKPQFAPVTSDTGEWKDFRDYIWDVPQTFLLTISNPGAILGVFALFGIVSTFVDVASTAQALWLVAATCAGATLWWIALAGLVGRIRHRVTEARLAQINVAAGWVLAAFGIVLLAEIPLKQAGISWRSLVGV